MSMSLKTQAISSLKKVTNLSNKQIKELIEIPPDQKMGDLAFPCFTLSKKFKKAPGEVAFQLRKKLVVPKGFRKVEVAGPYLNFYYDHAAISKEVLQVATKKDFGEKTKNKTKVIVESPGPNTNKPLHLGHLRNMALGQSVLNILKSQGNKVWSVDILNDRGVHICKSMLAYKKWGRNRKPNKKSDHFVGDFYVLFAKKSMEDPSLDKEIIKMIKKWEDGDKQTMALWNKMNQWAVKGMAKTYAKFGHKIDKAYPESSYYFKGKEIVFDGLKKGIFYNDKTGAVMVDLGKQLGEKVLLRSDGTCVYMTQDLYLTYLRYKDFKMDKAIWIVGNEQIYHFDVLFRIFKLLKFPFAKGCYHLAYGMVNLPEGKMKSREGKVVDADDLIADVVGFAKREIIKRNKLPKKTVDDLAQKIGVGAIKYFMLKYDARKDFVFNPKQSVSLEGDTGPYLQYSLVRASKILKKIKTKPNLKIDYSALGSLEEQALIKHIAKFPAITAKAAELYSPHIVANYAYKLAQLFSTFYEKHRVIGAPKNEEKARLLLVKTFHDTLKKAINLLGMDEVEVM